MRLLILVLSSVLLLGGCADEETAKTSHFEDDHEVAPHWPQDLADVAVKIRERLDAAESNPDQSQQIAQEVADLVGWIPEVAADTNLSEQDWIPLDQAAESLAANLRAAGNQLTEANRRQTLALCELIEQSLPNIPDHLPPRTRSAA